MFNVYVIQLYKLLKLYILEMLVGLHTTFVLVGQYRVLLPTCCHSLVEKLLIYYTITFAIFCYLFRSYNNGIYTKLSFGKAGSECAVTHCCCCSRTLYTATGCVAGLFTRTRTHVCKTYPNHLVQTKLWQPAVGFSKCVFITRAGFKILLN